MTDYIIKKLEASLGYDVLNGSSEEKIILGMQIRDAIRELKRLKKRDDILSRLEAAGVDNWEGYEIAMEEISE